MNVKNLVKTGVVCVGLVAGAHAQADEYVLSYSEAELLSSQGVEGVHHRIVQAAKDYCPTYHQIRSHADVAVCVDGVVQDLVEKVNHQKLTNYHLGRSDVQVAKDTGAKSVKVGAVKG